MGRKFKLRHVKYRNRRPSLSLPLSIPLGSVEVANAASTLCSMRSSLKICLPRDLFSASFPLENLLWSIKNSDILPAAWNSSLLSPEKLLIYKLKVKDGSPQVYCSIDIMPDYSWLAKVCGKTVPCQSILYTHASLTTPDQVSDIVAKMDSCTVCSGNEDSQFVTLATLRGGKFYNRTNEMVAYLDELLLPSSTVRHSLCEIFVGGVSRCSTCTQYRETLRAMEHRQRNTNSARMVDPVSHVNYRFLSDDQLKVRLHNSHTKSRADSRKLERLRRKVREIAEVNGCMLDPEADRDMRTIMQENSHVINSSAPDSFKKVFWEQQAKAASQSDARQMRWHPAMIKWCLYLRHRSNGAYEMLRDSGCIHLPSQRTLRDYTHVASSRIGFSKEVDSMLMQTSKIQTCPEHEKFVAVVFDEMHIRADLVYNKHNGELIGFINLGDINNTLLQVERSLEEQNPSPELAKSMLVFMVRGLFGPLKFPYAQFASKDLTGDIIFDPFWEVVYHLELCGFKVVAATADGATPNRAFFRIHFPKKDGAKYLYRTANPFTSDNRHIYFFSDPPHLLKTIRNCLASSKRQLWCEGKELSWRHLMSLYYRNNGAAQLSLVPKLKYEHVYLTSFSKMRVDLAAQALSGTVASALKTTGGPEAQKTAEFIEMVDKFFDCLNVSNFDAGKHSRNNFKDPFRPGDFRLKWLQNNFLAYLDKWECSVLRRQGDYTQAQRKKMQLSVETLTGIRFTVRSFIDMVNYLFSEVEVDCFLSEKIGQDPLEKFFGVQRQRGHVNENPSMNEFCQNTQALRVVNSVCLHVKRGNTRGSKTPVDEFVISDEPLTKRPRNQKK